MLFTELIGHGEHAAISTVFAPKLPWYDGCNTCSVRDGRLDACTEMYCERPKEPKCLDGDANGCSDDPSWCYGDCSPNDCEYVSQKVKPDGTLARCKEKNTDGERSALEACPATCGTC